MTAPPSPPAPSRFLVRPEPDRWRAVDLADVYLVEAMEDDARVRLRSREPLHDVRRLGELEEILAPAGFVRIHRSYLVNPARILELRRRDGGEGYEVIMEPPVNRVLPVSDERVTALRERFR
ncbi:MAG: LytTR family DNA-binding domain-containing protein [Thermoanaerobaculia bacterium]